jgi:hypothetical protein
MLPQKVAQGLMSERDAAYRRLYLQGENEQLVQAKRNRRYATPSYRTPLDVFESTRRGGAAKKYISESNNDGMPEGYFGDDNGSNGGSISSDWNENIEDFNVPDISVPPGPVQNLWPKHWPGNHSPAITKLVMDAGKVNGVQLVNPKADPEYKIATASLEKGIKVLSQYESLRDHVKNTAGFTPSDSVLVSQIETKVRSYVETAKKAAEQATPVFVADDTPAEVTQRITAERAKFPDGSRMDSAFQQLIEYVELLFEKNKATPSSWLTHVGVQNKIREINRQARDMNSPYADAFGLEAQAKKAEQMRQEAAARATEKVATFNPIRKHGNIIGYRIYINDIYTWMVKAVKEKVNGMTDEVVIVAYKRNADNKMALTSYRVETGIKVRPFADMPAIPRDLLKNLVNEIMDKVGTTNSLQGHRVNRRTGNLMGLGALQAHDRASFLVHEQGMTPTQRRSYLQAEREMALARKRAGAKVDITKQLREEPITRPWQMQVGLSTAALNAVSTRLNQQLASMNLSQEMFTQQMHTHVAAVINSMPSGMAPSEQAEMIIERVMAKVTNSSGLLKKDVKVDINRGSTSPLTFSSSESLSGVVGSLSGTRAALGRLLR